MTRKADFNAEEWSLVLEGPPLAGMIVISADRGGTLRESVAMAKTYAELRQDHEGNELVAEIVGSRPELDPGRYGSPDELRTKGIARLREAVALLEQKAENEEVEGYRRFVVDLARRAAEAHKEGGFLGIGGTKVSEAEFAALEEVATAVGAEAPPRP
jgi:hypothetical protein